ncbi:hypothetical protein DBY73_017425 [Enterobacter sp. RIT418]|nr:hypothetical protein DBY73_017425 [Enterobacter sp. RIT 418]
MDPCPNVSIKLRPNSFRQGLQDDYKRTKAKLIEIEDALAAIQTQHPGKRLAKSNTNHLA